MSSVFKLEEKANLIEMEPKEDKSIRIEFKDANFTWGFRLKDKNS